MHFGIVAIGSRGDVQPYVALALGLVERGHETTILAHENFRDFVEGYGLRFYPLVGNVEAMLQSEEGLKVLKSGRILAYARHLQKTISKTRDAVTRDLYHGCKNADVLVTSLLGIPWVDCIAEKTGKKWAIVQLNFPEYNRLTYRIFQFLYWRSNKKGINDFRKTLGLQKLKTPVFKKITDEKILNLHSLSPALLSRPQDWEAHNDITGFLFLPPDINYKIPGGLIHWMEAGDKPIYIGFGSMPVPDPVLFQSVLFELLQSTSHRFIYCRGWSLPVEWPEHEQLFIINSVSHEWLFPRCKTAIIHGGAGTTAAALKAKIPLIIISIIADQPWWGKIIERKKLGVHIPFRKLTSQKLLTAIEKTGTSEIKRNARKMGEQISQEDGLKKTIDALEKYFAF